MVAVSGHQGSLAGKIAGLCLWLPLAYLLALVTLALCLVPLTLLLPELFNRLAEDFVTYSGLYALLGALMLAVLRFDVRGDLVEAMEQHLGDPLAALGKLLGSVVESDRLAASLEGLGFAPDTAQSLAVNVVAAWAGLEGQLGATAQASLAVRTTMATGLALLVLLVAMYAVHRLLRRAFT